MVVAGLSYGASFSPCSVVMGGTCTSVAYWHIGCGRSTGTRTLWLEYSLSIGLKHLAMTLQEAFVLRISGVCRYI